MLLEIATNKKPYGDNINFSELLMNKTDKLIRMPETLF